MNKKLSKRLQELADALPLRKGIRVLEIGCGPGALAREIASRIGNGYVLGLDRSAKAIQQAIAGSNSEMKKHNLAFRHTSIENFELTPSDKLFDLAVAIRVGVLDGRHPEIEKQVLKQIAKALKKGSKLYIDGGDPLKEISLDKLTSTTN